MATYNFYADPSHGWLKVRRSEISELGLTNRISSFSYQRKDFVYLEEDYDMKLFFDAKGYDVDYRIHHTDRSSKIRSYNRYHA